MADLDDFFAKKDRKKANRKKFTTTDEIAKKLEETGKKVEKPKKEKPPPISQVPGEGEEEQVHQVEEIHEEDEWREFEEEKKDYTGLKIGHLQINEGENNIGTGDDEEDQMEENEAGEMVMRRKVQSGPWKIVNPQSQPPAMEVQEPQVLEELPSGGQIVKGAYKPPHLRNPSKEQSHATPRTKSKLAPDISDEKYFPSLSAAKSVEPSGAWGRRRRDEGNFEEVRNSKSHSSRFGETGNKATSGTGPSLNLGNKFGALSHDQS